MRLVPAGGADRPQAPLTADRPSPAVPFGGLDFAVSNLVNADILRVYVLTGYKSQSLTARPYPHTRSGKRVRVRAAVSLAVITVTAEQRGQTSLTRPVITALGGG